MTRKGLTARQGQAWHLVAVVALGAMLLLSRVVDPSALPTFCLFKRLTGIPCMTCGLTRAFHAISVGDFSGALRLHPLSPLVYALVILHFFSACVRLVGRRVPQPSAHNTLLLGTLGLLCVVWVVRLLVGFPSVL